MKRLKEGGYGQREELVVKHGQMKGRRRWTDIGTGGQTWTDGMKEKMDGQMDWWSAMDRWRGGPDGQKEELKVKHVQMEGRRGWTDR